MKSDTSLFNSWEIWLSVKLIISSNIILPMPSVNSFFGMKELLEEKQETPEEVFESIAKVTKEDVYNIAKKLFKKDSLNLGIIGPYKDQDKFAKMLLN